MITDKMEKFTSFPIEAIEEKFMKENAKKEKPGDL